MPLTDDDFTRGYTEATAGGGSAGIRADEITAVTLLKWFSDAYRAQEEFRRKTVEALKMVSGDQWPSEALAQLPRNMAPVVINKMLMPIMYLSGVQRQTRQEAKVLAAVGASAHHAELMNALVHWNEGLNIAEETDSRVFLDKIVTGLGWWKYAMNYDCDDLEGEIQLLRRHTLSIFPDPNFFDDTWDTASYVFDTEFMTTGEATTKWPEHTDEFKKRQGEWLAPIQQQGGGTATMGAFAGDAFSAERLFWDEQTKRIRIAECWYKETKKRTIGINLSDPSQIVQEPDQVKRLQEFLKTQPQSEWVTVKKSTTIVQVKHFFHQTILDEGVTPFEENLSTLPLFPSIGYYFWKEPFGIAAMMNDLQLEINKRRSKLIELTGRMPNSGFFVKEGEVDPQQMEEYGAGNGVTISYKTVEPTPIKPPTLPMALIDLEKKASDEIKDVPNIHNELLGQATQKTISGAAISARQRGGLLSHEHLFDTARLEKQARVQFLIGAIKQFISPTKALRILGTLATGGNPMAQQMQQQMQAPQGYADVQTILSEAYDAEYDVVISARPTEPSLAMEAWEQLVELKQGGADIPPKTFWEAAQRAGILSEGQVSEIMEYIQGQMAAQQGAAQGVMPPGGAPTPGPSVGPASPPPSAAGPTAQ